jgi:hypothetical protein
MATKTMATKTMAITGMAITGMGVMTISYTGGAVAGSSRRKARAG